MQHPVLEATVRKETGKSAAHESDAKEKFRVSFTVAASRTRPSRWTAESLRDCSITGSRSMECSTSRYGAATRKSRKPC